MKNNGIRKVLSMLLCLAMAVSTVPAAVLAEDAEPEEVLLEGINISAVGSFKQVDKYAATGAYVSREDENDPNSRYLSRFMGSSTNLYDIWAEEPTRETELDFLIPTYQEVRREITLYGHEDLDESKIALAGAEIPNGFTANVYGDGGGELYYYTAEIVIPAKDCDVQLSYDGDLLHVLHFHHIIPIWPSDAVYLTNLSVESYSLNERGIVASFTLKFAGYNLPVDPERYHIGMDDWDPDTGESVWRDVGEILCLSGPDAVGYYTMELEVIGSDGIADLNDICWLDFRVDGRTVNFFEASCLYQDSAHKYLNNERYDYGVFATICPFYSLHDSEPYVARPLLSAPESTESNTVSISIDPRDYAGGRMGWTTVLPAEKSIDSAIADSVTVTLPKKAYGLYTVTFFFSKEGLRDCIRSRTILYKPREGFVRAEYAPTLASETLRDVSGTVWKSVTPGTEITGVFTALSEDGWTQRMVLTYTDLDGEPKRVEAVPEDLGREIFRGSVRIPNDADTLTEVRYELVNPNGAVNNFVAYDFSGYRTYAEAVAYGFDETYAGASLKLSRGSFRKTWLLDAKNCEELSLGDLATGTYHYEITGKSGYIASGDVGVVRGETVWFTVPELCTFRSCVDGETIPATTALTLKNPDGETHRITAAAGQTLTQIPAGTQIHAEISFDTDAYRDVTITERAKDLTLNDSGSMAFTAEKLQMRSLAGTVSNARSGRVSGVTVTVTQQIERCGKTETVTTSTKTDSSGAFSIEVYDGFNATLECRGLYGSSEPMAVNAVDTEVGDVSLTKPADFTVILKMKYVDTLDGERIETSLDSAYLNVRGIQADGSYLTLKDFTQTVVDGQLILTVPAGKIPVTADLSKLLVEAVCTDVNGMKVATDSLRAPIKADANGNAIAEFTVRPNFNELRGTLVEDGSGSVGFLSVLNASGACYYAYGTGELRVAYPEAGTWTIVALKIREADAETLAACLGSDPYNAGVLMTRIKDYFPYKYGVNVQDRYLSGVVSIGTSYPRENIDTRLFPPYTVRYTTEMSTTPGYIHISGVLEKRNPNVDDRAYLAHANLKVNTETFNWNQDANYLPTAFTINGEQALKNTYPVPWTWVKSESPNPSKWNKLSACQAIPFSAEVPMTTGNQIRFKLEIGCDNGETGTYVFCADLNVFDLDVPVFYSIPRTSLGAERETWSLPFTLRAFPEDTDRENVVTVWDNGTAVATVNFPGNAQSFATGVQLTDCGTPGVHVLWATREIETAPGVYETISTERRICTLTHQTNEDVYISNLYWLHYNESKGAKDIPDYLSKGGTPDNLAGKTLTIWPGKRSDMTFRVNNACSDEIFGVDLVIYQANGSAAKRYSAVLTSEVHRSEGQFPYSEWSIENFDAGYVSALDFQIIYKASANPNAAPETKRRTELTTYYWANGLGEVSDDEAFIDDLLSASAEDVTDALSDASLPGFLSDLSLNVTVNTASSFKADLTAPTAQVQDYEVTMSKLPEITLNDLYLQMEAERATGKSTEAGEEGWDVTWSETESLQGRTIVRIAVYSEKLANDNWRSVMHSKTYMPEALVDYFEGNPVLMAEDDDEKPLYKGYQVGNEIYTYTDIGNTWYTEAVYNAEEYITGSKDLAKQASDKASFIPKKLGTAMNWLGVADAAYTYYKGPSGKDPATLAQMLTQVKDEKFRRSIEAQIRDYDDMRNSIFRQEMTIKTIGAAANFAPTGFWGKVAVLVGSKGFDFFNDKAKDYNQEVYNLTMHDIQRQLKFEQYKEERAAAEAEFRKKMDRIYGAGYWSERLLMEEKTFYVLDRDKDGKLRYMWKQSVSSFKPYYDPSGYVFEAVEEDRLDGVKATLYYSNSLDEDGNPIDFCVWEDPTEDILQRQENPLYTAEGRYAWMVPVGWWKVRYEAEGYRTTESVPMQVPPIHTTVNIGMLSEEAPRATWGVADGKIYVIFDKYMQLESLIRLDGVSSGGEAAYADTAGVSYADVGFDSSCFAVRFLDAYGRPVTGTVSFPDRTENTGYDGSGYGTDIIESDYFVRTAVFTPDSPLAGEPSVTFADGILSYAGVPLSAEPATVSLIGFDAAGGTFGIAYAVTGSDGKLASLAEPSREAYDFDGWYTAETGGTQVAADTVFERSMTLYAHWTKDANALNDYSVETAVSGSDLAATFTANNSTLRGDTVVLAAAYDQNGRFLKAQTKTVTFDGTDQTRSFTFADCAEASVRVFLTAEQYEPIWASAVK